MNDDRPTTGKGKNVMGVALVAAAVGAAAGLLLAPKRGVDTREELKNKYNGMKNKTQDAAHSARDKVNQGVETARDKVHSVTDRAADKTKDVTEKAADKTKSATAKTAPETSLAEEIAAAERNKRSRGL